LKNSVSFIHGPPGTGKTAVSAAIIVTLHHHEQGIIVAAAPSNIACDGLCLAIQKASTIFKPKVLRIYAKSRETALLAGESKQ